MMWAVRKVIVLAGPLFLAVACDQSDKANNSMDTKQTYSLCPKTDDARQRLYENVNQFSDQQQAKVIDRGSGAQKELSDIGSNVLKNTGGDTVLLTIEKTGEFRISVTNLGLKEKLALAIRSFEGHGNNAAVDRFMSDLGRFWTIQGVDGGVTDDPPC